jgi:hypothetical protein
MSRNRNRAVRPSCIFSFVVFCSVLMSVPANFCQAQVTAEGTAVLTGQFVTLVTVTNAGSGYSVPPAVSFTGGGGSGATAFAQITNGYVSSINVSNTGSGYSTPPTVVIEPPLFDLNNTLVGYWPFQGNVNDASTYNQTGIVVVGSISYPAGVVGTAVAVSGGSDVDIGTPSDGRYDIGAGQDFTVSIWVNTTMSGLNDYRMLLTKETGYAPRQGWLLFFNASDNGIPGFNMYSGGSGAGVYSAVRVNDGQWHHLLVTKRGTSLAFYTDGILQDTEPCANVDYSTTTGLRLGTHYANLFSPYNGAADELRLYKRALEPREVKALCGRLPAITHPQNAVAHWGQTACLSITAIGATPLTYRWYKDDQLLPQATSATLCITNAQATNAGIYRVTVSNSFGIVYSQPATVLVDAIGAVVSLYPGITLDGVVGQTYGIQSSTDLNNTNGWVGLANVVLTTQRQLWYDSESARSCACDSSVSPPKRFYRVMLGPITVP